MVEDQGLRCHLLSSNIKQPPLLDKVWWDRMRNRVKNSPISFSLQGWKIYIFSSHLHHPLQYGRSCLHKAFFESSKHCHPHSSSHQSMGCNLYKGCVDLSHWSHKQLMAGATPAEPLQPPTKSLLSNCLLCFVFSSFNRTNLNVLPDFLFSHAILISKKGFDYPL